MWLVLIGGLWGAGQFRLADNQKFGTGVTLRVVQGNVPQTDKWDPGQRDAIIQRYLNLSARPGDYDVLLWPETAVPAFLDESPEIRADIRRQLTGRRVLLTGTPDRERAGPSTLYRNAVVAIGSDGLISARYSKHHLVPFGDLKFTSNIAASPQGEGSAQKDCGQQIHVEHNDHGCNQPAQAGQPAGGNQFAHLGAARGEHHQGHDGKGQLEGQHDLA